MTIVSPTMISTNEMKSAMKPTMYAPAMSSTNQMKSTVISAAIISTPTMIFRKTTH